MQPLRIYLLIRMQSEWLISVHRDFESFTHTWALYAGRNDISVVLHAGFSRPGIAEFNDLTDLYKGKVLVTASCRWIFTEGYGYTSNPVAVISDIPIYLALKGWGYEEVAEPTFVISPQSLPREATTDIRLHVLKSCPAWVLDFEIKDLDFSVRVRNVLAANGITTVRSLSKISEEELFRFANFGRTSLRNLNETILRFIKVRESIPSTNAVEEIEDISCEGENTFLNLLEDILDKINPKIAEILIMRMGLRNDAMTLQEAGDVFGFSRERARQLESKGINKLGNLGLRDHLEGRLNQVLMNRSDPVSLMGLEILDPFFIGVQKVPSVLKYLFNKLFDNRFNIFSINGELMITKLSPLEWDAICRHALNLLQTGCQQEWTLSETRKRISELLPLRASELKSELWARTQRFAHFSSAQTEEPRLLTVGRNVEALVETVLVDSRYPLHYSEVHKLIKERFGRSIDVRRIHNVLQDVALIFGRGIYGLVKHCPLNDKELAEVRSYCEDLILGGTPGRQWTCSELTDLMAEDGLDFDGRVNYFLVNIALLSSTSVVNLKRMVWTQATDVAMNANDRIELSQAVEALLIKNGSPMSIRDIKDALRRDRGLGMHFQMQPIGSLIRVGIGVWGLVERDLPFDKAERDHLATLLRSLLQQKKEGIHISEVEELLKPIFPQINMVSDPLIIFALAQKYSGFRISTNKYLYLEEWEGPRRLNLSQAILKVLDGSPQGLRASEIVEKVSQLLQRPISRDSIYSPLFAIGAVYKDDIEKWVLSDQEEEIDTSLV